MAASKVTRTSLVAASPPAPRAPGAIVAKETQPTVEALRVLADELIVSHREGLADSPGGITVRRLADYQITRQTIGCAGAVTPFGELWLASGPLWRGREASTVALDPVTFACRARLPVCRPIAVRDGARFLAATPARGYGTEAFDVDPALVAASWVELPRCSGLVEVDVRAQTTELVLAAAPHDDFVHAALSPAGDVLYATTSFGRTVAVRLADRAVVWERPAAGNVVAWSGHALALDPTGRYLALGGSSATGADLQILATTTGQVESHLNLVALVNAARVAPTPSARIEALAFHPSGWLAAATNGGVVAELQPSGAVSAFRAAMRGISALAFAFDGATLIVGGAERHLRAWPVDL